MMHNYRLGSYVRMEFALVQSSHHCMKVWIYNIFTTVQMWRICVCKYGICDISAIVNESFIFTMVLVSHIPYLLTHLYHFWSVVNIL